MLLFNSFWTYVTLVFIAVLAILALAIWGSSDSEPLNTPKPIAETSSVITDKTTTAFTASTEAAPSNFPAPAKKLHQLINEAESDNSLSLDEKIQQLDKQLAVLNKQLKTKGVDVPEQQSQTAVSHSSGTESRLKSIKDHLNQKQPLSN